MKRVLILVAALALLTAGCQKTFSNGTRVGVVQKFSNKGVVNKSWEGELALPGFSSTGGEHPTLTNVWEFSVEEGHPEIIAQLQAAQESGRRVKITYRQILLNSGISYDSDYRVEKVEVLGS